MEIWKEISGYEGRYEASTLGNIRSVDRIVEVLYRDTFRYRNRKGKLLKPFINHKGYLMVDLGDKTHSVHRLIALTFIPNQLNKEQVNHINNDKTNNNVENLEWCTNQENMTHSQQFKSYEYLKRKIAQIDLNTGDIIKIWYSTRDARRAGFNGVDKVALDKYKHFKTCKGFGWKYI